MTLSKILFLVGLGALLLWAAWHRYTVLMVRPNEPVTLGSSVPTTHACDVACQDKSDVFVGDLAAKDIQTGSSNVVIGAADPFAVTIEAILGTFKCRYFEHGVVFIDERGVPYSLDPRDRNLNRIPCSRLSDQ